MRKREQTDLKFSFLVFCCISNMLVCWVTFSLKPPLEFINFCLLTSLWLVFNCISIPHRLMPFTLKNRVVPSLLLAVSGRNIHFHNSTHVPDLGTSSFLYSTSINAVIHPWPADPQLPQPKSLWSQLPAPISAFFFLLTFFFSISFLRN